MKIKIRDRSTKCRINFQRYKYKIMFLSSLHMFAYKRRIINMKFDVIKSISRKERMQEKEKNELSHEILSCLEIQIKLKK